MGGCDKVWTKIDGEQRIMTEPKEKKLTSVSRVLEELLSRGESPLSDQFLRWRLWHSWSEVVGEKMAQVSTPVGFQKGLLMIWVRSPVYMQELSYGLDLLREKINSFVGFNWVAAIRLTQDRRSVPAGAASEELHASITKVPGAKPGDQP